MSTSARSFCTAGLFLVTTILLPGPVVAETPSGTTDQVVHPVVFQANETNVQLDPNPETGIRVRKTFSNNETAQLGQEIGAAFISSMFSAIGINLGDWCILDDSAFEVCALDVLGAGVNPSLNSVVDVRAGGYFEVLEVGGADINITYPVNVTVTYPRANSFSCGDTIVINTRCVVASGANLDITPPSYDTEVGLVIEQLSLGVMLDVCLPLGLGCASDFFSGYNGTLSTPALSIDQDIPLFTVCADGIGMGDSTLFGCSNSDSVFLDYGLLPLINFSSDTPDQTCVEPGPVFPIPEFEGCFSRAQPNSLTTAASGSCNEDFRITAQGTASDILTLSTDIVSWVDAVLCPLPPGPVGCTDIDLGVVSVDLGDVSPTYFIDQQMDFQFTPTTVSLEVDFGIPTGFGPVNYRVLDPATNLEVSNGVGTSAIIRAGQDIEIDFPAALRQPITVDPEYSLAATFQTGVTHLYFMGMQFALLQLQIDGVINDAVINPTPIFREPTGGALVQDHTLTIDSYFSRIQMPQFLLDPENPIIDVTRLELQDVVNLGRGERAVIYGMDLRNSGDVLLESLGLDMDLSQIFGTAQDFSVACVNSNEFLVNSNYDGVTDRNLLHPSNSIAVGGEGTVEIVVIVKPEISAILADGCFDTVDYFASVSAHAVSCIGTPVRSNFDECTGLATAEDIVAAVDLGAAVINELGDYALYAFEDMKIARGMNLSLGNVGSADALQVLPLAGEFSSDLRIVGDVHVGGDLQIVQSQIEVDYVQLTGDLLLASPQAARLDLTGALSQATSCAALFPVPTGRFPHFPGGAQVVVSAGESLLLAPGNYKKITLEAGSQLVLSSGDYAFKTLRVTGDDASMLMDDTLGPVVVHADKWQMSSQQGFSILSTGVSGATRNLFVNYYGNPPLDFDGGVVQGTLFAPRAEVRFEAARLEGACYAERIRMEAGSSFAHHDFLEDDVVDPGCAGTYSPASVPSAADRRLRSKSNRRTRLGALQRR